MDGRRRASSSCKEDEKVQVKAAAAWAWHQRGSGDEGDRRTLECDVHRPARYKLEANHVTQEANHEMELEPSSSTMSPTRSESSLLDFYEVQRITHELDLLIASSRGQAPQREAAPLPRVATKKLGGFFARHAVGICGSTGDVVEARAVAAARRRKLPLSASSVGGHAV